MDEKGRTCPKFLTIKIIALIFYNQKKKKKLSYIPNSLNKK